MSTSEESKDGSEDLCYICYDEGSELNPFIEKQVCACKGSIKCHQLCLELSKLTKKCKNSKGTCSICKNSYNTETFLDESKWQIYEDRLYKYITCFKILDSNVVKHGEYYRLNICNNWYTIAEKGRYYEDSKDGIWEHYFPDETLFSIESYNKGKKHGKFITYWNDREICKSSIYVDDKIHGIQYIKPNPFYDIIIKNLFNYGIPIGIHTELLSLNDVDDMKLYRGKYENGLSHGVWTLYLFDVKDFSPKIFKKVTYKNGVLDGPLLVYHENGKISKEVHYKDGKKHGLRRSFNEKGNIREYMYFKNGVLDGPFCLFEYRNDKRFPFFKGQLKNGFHYGKHLLYESSNFPLQIYNYNDKGELNGPIYFYNPSGRMIAMFTFRNGILHGKQISNDTDELDFKIEFMAKNGLVSGKVKYMNSNKEIEELYVNQISLEDLEEIVNLDLLIKLPSYINENCYIIDNYLNSPLPCDCDEYEEDNYSFSFSYITESDYDIEYDRDYYRYRNRDY